MKAIGLCLLVLTVFSGQASGQEIRVTLLGTGSPNPNPDRFGPATLVEAGSEKMLFDAGRGVTIRLAQAGVSLSEISGVFITHFHSDHLNGLADLWMSSYMPPDSRQDPFPLFGPTDLEALAQALQTGFRPDFEGRGGFYAAANLPFNGAATEIKVTSYDDEGIVFDRGGVTVRAIAVKHSPVAFGYRVDYEGRSVVVSGDTQPSANLVEHARNADVLIHEVFAVDQSILESSPLLQRVERGHTTPRQAAEIFEQVHPRLAVFTHVVRVGTSEDQLVDAARQSYSGRLLLGQDLMSISVGDEVSVSQLVR